MAIKKHEIEEILNKREKINILEKIKDLRKLYKSELKDFKYVVDPNLFLTFKKKYVRYIEFNNNLNYGGFLYKTEKINNNFIIYLINKDKKIWTIDFNKNYIFVHDIITENDKLRANFEKYLNEK